MQGGRFGHGFASAGVSAAAVGGMNGAGIKGPARVIGAAIAGGTASVVSGGKFANGAMTAAFMAAAGNLQVADKQFVLITNTCALNHWIPFPKRKRNKNLMRLKQIS